MEGSGDARERFEDIYYHHLALTVCVNTWVCKLHVCLEEYSGPWFKMFETTELGVLL